MGKSPPKSGFVADPMPPIEDERGYKVREERRQPVRQSAHVKEGPTLKPSIPGDAADDDGQYLKCIDGDGSSQPARHLWLLHAWNNPLNANHQQADRD